MMYFNGYDIDGNSCRVDEQGNEIGFVTSVNGWMPAVRLDASVYMAVDGRVYASDKRNCSTYSTEPWRKWARTALLKKGFSPQF